jgi:hypothetical protein
MKKPVSATFMNEDTGLSYECSATDCKKPVAFVRSTQFAGDHFYCEHHAKLEDDFMKDDASYSFWETIKEYEKRLEDSAKRKKKELEKYEKAKQDILEEYNTVLREISFTHGISIKTLEEIYDKIGIAKNVEHRKFFGLRIP